MGVVRYTRGTIYGIIMMMNKIIFQKIQDKAKDLHCAFQETSKENWIVQDIVAELTIQVGHIVTASGVSVAGVNEAERKLDDIDDEIADVLLQTMVLAYLFGSKVEDFEITDNSYREYSTSDVVLTLYQITSQLTESSMRLNGKRFPQKRDTSHDGEEAFFLHRLNKLISLLLHFAKQQNMDIENCFETMEQGAYNFLSGYNEYLLTVQDTKNSIQKENIRIAKKLNELQQERGNENGTD